ncbi:MAG: hypothetical protein ACE5MH_05450 [Terriglobia bacterium]
MSVVMLFGSGWGWAQSAPAGVSAGELLRGIGLGAALVAIVGLVLVEFVYRDRLPRDSYHWLLFLGLFVLPSTVLLGTMTTVFEETKRVEACATCHVMDAFVNDMRNPQSATLAARHYRNKWIADHQCYSCHTTYGVHGTLAGKRDGFRHWLLYVTRTWEEPIRYHGSYPNSNCLACHGETQRFEEVGSHQALARDLATDRVGCARCHGPPHPVPSARVSRGSKR